MNRKNRICILFMGGRPLNNGITKVYAVKPAFRVEKLYIEVHGYLASIVKTEFAFYLWEGNP